MSHKNDNIYTNPSYSSLPGNIYYNPADDEEQIKAAKERREKAERVRQERRRKNAQECEKDIAIGDAKIKDAFENIDEEKYQDSDAIRNKTVQNYKSAKTIFIILILAILGIIGVGIYFIVFSTISVLWKIALAFGCYILVSCIAHYVGLFYNIMSDIRRSPNYLL